MKSLHYTKVDGKYYKDNPEAMRIRNAVRPIAYEYVGGKKNFYTLSEGE